MFFFIGKLNSAKAAFRLGLAANMRLKMVLLFTWVRFVVAKFAL
jgi:hypothetical protein